MNLSIFPVASTNIFPLANDTKNSGQLMTEYNLTSRESVGTWESVNYRIGPSFCHSRRDFLVQQQTDGAGGITSSSILEITGGTAVINGHFLEVLEPIAIDLLDLNAQAKLEGTDPLKGKLCVGLRAMYSTLPTMAGAMLVNNKDEMYEGVQVVILPKEKFKLPTDVPNNRDKVTAHLKLAEFNFINGAINTVDDNYPERIQYVSSERIANINKLISDMYVSKLGLNPKKLYVFSGKGTDPETGKDTWCEAQDSLVVWDVNPKLTTQKQTLREATFEVDTKGKTELHLPHKQVDGMTDTSGKAQYYEDKHIKLPLANFSAGTSGTVDKNYTDHVKDIIQKFNNIMRLPNGKQVGYLELLEDREEDLPPINPSWNVGDYILVNQDNTLDASTDGVKPPAVMYVVLPGVVSKYKFVKSVENSTKVPAELKGIELDADTRTADEEVDTSDPEVYNAYFDMTYEYRGIPNVDYFLITKIVDDTHYTCYYYTPSEVGQREYSEPVWVTGEIPFAQEEVIGGFYNVPESSLDNGYVFRNADGHLQLLDYGLLRSGTLAYQLGEDFSTTEGITATEIQDSLNDYVNKRVAFANNNHMKNADDPLVINVTINISEEEEEQEITIHEIDSRFNTSVYLHITGKATENCTINIADCEKIRIDSNIGGTPKINLYRSCLYYDSNILEYLNEIENISFWYQKYKDDEPNLIVDNMTIRETDAPVIPDDLDYWNEKVPNDNHFMFALQSITFNGSGDIVGCGVYVKNETSANISEGNSVITSKFSLPQGAGLIYPRNRLTKQLKVTGSFVNAYPVDVPKGYMVLDTNFSLLTEAYDEYNTEKTVEGTVAFYVRAMVVDNIVGLPAGTPIDAWESNAFHYFLGSTIG